MKIILTKDVEGLGKAGDTVNVKDGYARNFLIPRNLGVAAGRRSTGFLENEKRKLELKKTRLLEEAQKLAQRLRNISCTIAMPVGEDDKLYGEVTAEAISNFYKQEGMEIDKRKISLEAPPRRVGVYQAEIKLHPEVSTSIKVWVVKK